MEDINDEILDLEQSIHVVVHNNQTDEATAEEDETTEESSGCSVAGAFVNCSSDVYETPSRLEKSKAYVNEQIRRLRSQLFELKEIRKHLQRKQPKLPRQSKTQQTSSVKKKCVCSKPRQSGWRQEQRVARRRQLRQRKERRRKMKKAKKIRKEKRKQKRMKDFGKDDQLFLLFNQFILDSICPFSIDELINAIKVPVTTNWGPLFFPPNLVKIHSDFVPQRSRSSPRVVIN